MYEWIYNPCVTFLSSEVEQDMNWLCYWMFNDLKDENEDLDMNWRFKDEMEEGDEVEFSMDLGIGITVKNCAIHLLCQPTDSQPDESAMIPFNSSRHQRRFLHTRTRFLTIEGIQQVTSEQDLSPPRDQEYFEWTEKRKQRQLRWSGKHYDNIYKLLIMGEESRDGSHSFKVQQQRDSATTAKVLREIVKMEIEIFPKCASSAAAFDEELKKNNTGLLYLEISEDVVGYAMYSWPSSLFACITKLAVDEKHRKQGHGEALMKAVIERCKTRKVQWVSLHVDTLNTAAFNLYRKLGFRVVEFAESYYSADRSAYIMHLDVDSD